MKMIAEFFAGDYFVWIAISVIALFAIIYYLKLQLKINYLLKEIKSTIISFKRIKDSQELIINFEKINKDIAGNKIVGDLWNQFKKTIVNFDDSEKQCLKTSSHPSM